MQGEVVGLYQAMSPVLSISSSPSTMTLCDGTWVYVEPCDCVLYGFFFFFFFFFTFAGKSSGTKRIGSYRMEQFLEEVDASAHPPTVLNAKISFSPIQLSDQPLPPPLSLVSIAQV